MLRAPRRPSRRVAAAVVTALTLGLASACSGGTATPAGSTPASPTPIRRLNTAEMEVHRIPFCDLLPGPAVTDALGHRATGQERWSSGEATRFVGGTGDRAQEFGCRFSASSAVAEAWVFASPVESAFASSVVREAARRPGCRVSQTVGFGSPSVQQTCRSGDTVRVRHAGLFGQTWLSCQVSAPLPVSRVTRRADGWCVQVANALNTAH